MGYYKKKLQEDMELHPESYKNDESEYMTEEELKKQMKETIKFRKQLIKSLISDDAFPMDGSAVKKSFEEEGVKPKR